MKTRKIPIQSFTAFQEKTWSAMRRKGKYFCHISLSWNLQQLRLWLEFLANHFDQDDSSGILRAFFLLNEMFAYKECCDVEGIS